MTLRPHVNVAVPERILAELAEEARARGVGPAALVRNILTAVARDNLVAAVLDDTPFPGDEQAAE